MKLLIM